MEHQPSGRTRSLPGVTIAGAVVSGLLASVCCIGPLLLAVLGIGGAGLLAGFDAYRPIFTVITFALLVAGFRLAHRKPHRAGDACGCEHRVSRPLLFIAAIVAVLFWASPYVIDRVLR